MIPKTISFTILSLITASPNDRTLPAQLNIEKNVNSLCDSVNSQSNRNAQNSLINSFCNIAVANRTLNTGGISFSLSDVDGYACWCYIDGQSGHGKPIGETDTHCHKLHMGYDCIMMDSNDMNIECDSKEVDYVVDWIFEIDHTNTFTWTFDCAANLEFCAQKSCIVESHFIRELVSQGATVWENYDTSMRHSANFDAQAECYKTRDGNGVGGTGRNIECCGEYPFRYPYNTKHGLVQCCSNGRPSMVC